MSTLDFSAPRPFSAAFATLVAALLAAVMLASSLAAQAPEETAVAEETAPPREVMLVRIASPIHPVAAEFVAESLAEADERRVEAVLIELNTPGGLLPSTREITQSMLTARTPVVVYVAPSGAQAASAGFFILMAADVAAMAPGTNTGAAHPVTGQGEDIEGDMRRKVEEDSAANIRSLARRHGRNVELAEKAVLESDSYTAQEALESGLVELVAASRGELLEALDGRTVEKAGGEPRTLRTAGAEVVEREMAVFQRFLATLSHPTIAAILLALGMLGLYMELSNPGTFLPGIVGAICLILGFYAMSVLPINYAGVALLVLALVLFIAETQVPTFGLLTAGGAIALVLGTVMLVKDVEPWMQVHYELLAAVVVGLVAVVVVLTRRSLQVRRSRVTTGKEGLVGERGVARTELGPRGKVFVHGEVWTAVADGPVPAGAAIEVAAVDGMLLHVKAIV